MNGEKKPTPLINTPGREAAGQFSPDGRWIAYVSDESGQPDVSV
jgi:Tol biopolymer transport system component